MNENNIELAELKSLREELAQCNIGRSFDIGLTSLSGLYSASVIYQMINDFSPRQIVSLGIGAGSTMIWLYSLIKMNKVIKNKKEEISEIEQDLGIARVKK